MVSDTQDNGGNNMPNEVIRRLPAVTRVGAMALNAVCRKRGCTIGRTPQKIVRVHGPPTYGAV